MIPVIAIIIGVTVGSIWRAHDDKNKVKVPNSQEQTQEYLQKGKQP